MSLLNSLKSREIEEENLECVVRYFVEPPLEAHASHERLLDDGWSFHNALRVLWPPFEKALLEHESSDGLTKAGVVPLRVFFKTLPLRLFAVVGSSPDLRVSEAGRLPFIGRPTFDDVLVALERASASEQSLEVVQILFFYCPIVFWAEENVLSEHVRKVAQSALKLLYPLRKVFLEDITNVFHERFERPFAERKLAELRRDPLWSPLKSFWNDKIDWRSNVMLASQSFVDSSQAFTMDLFVHDNGIETAGVCFLGPAECTEGPIGHVHGGCLATLGDLASAYAAQFSGAMTLSLEIIYRMPVPLRSVLFFSGRRESLKSVGGKMATLVDFFDLTGQLKFSAKGVFSRPKMAAKL